jgi:hypothetical protein
MRRLSSLLLLTSALACGDDAGGLGAASDASHASMEGGVGAESGVAVEAGDGAMARSSDGAMVPTASDASDATGPAPSDASVDAGSIADSGPSDGAMTDHAQADGGACAQLSQCCGRTRVPPPFAAACRLAADLIDGGGDSGTCESVLSGLQDAGVCP